VRDERRLERDDRRALVERRANLLRDEYELAHAYQTSGSRRLSKPARR
jgi:hypothetical protein